MSTSQPCGHELVQALPRDVLFAANGTREEEEEGEAESGGGAGFGGIGAGGAQFRWSATDLPFVAHRVSTSFVWASFSSLHP